MFKKRHWTSSAKETWPTLSKSQRPVLYKRFNPLNFTKALNHHLPSCLRLPTSPGQRQNGSSNRGCGFPLRRKLQAKGMPLQRPPVLRSEVSIATTLWRTNKSSWPWLHIMRTPESWWFSCLLCCKKKGLLLHLHREVGAAGPQEDRQHPYPSQGNSEDKSAVVKPVRAIRTNNNDIHNNLGRCFPGSKINGWHCQPWKGKVQKFTAKLVGMLHAYCWVSYIKT